jgi:hypothetical protein
MSFLQPLNINVQESNNEFEHLNGKGLPKGKRMRMVPVFTALGGSIVTSYSSSFSNASLKRVYGARIFVPGRPD